MVAFVLCLLLALPPAPADDCTSATQPGAPSPQARFATWVDLDYTGPSVQAHCGQRYNVFVPEGPQPPEGWPVLVVFDLSGYRTSRRLEWLDPQDTNQVRSVLAWHALTDPAMPMVVVYASATVSRGGASGNAEADPLYDPWAATPMYGSAYPGNGVFIPPEVVPHGYPVSPAPYDDVLRPMPEKDAIMVIQHVRHHADSFPPGEAGALKLDTSRLAVYGDSAGAISLMWCVLGPDRGPWTCPPAVPGSQEEQSARVPAAVLHAGAVHFPRYLQDNSLSIAGGVHLPELVTGSLYDQPAPALQDSKLWQDDASALIYGDDGQSGEVSALNAAQALFLSYEEPSSVPEPLCFDKNPVTGAPASCWYDRDVEANIHSSWHGHAWKQRFDNTYLVATESAAYDEQGWLLGNNPQPGVPAVADLVLPDGTTRHELAQHQMAWLRDRFLGSEGLWETLAEGASPGSQGEPRLEGVGTMKPDAPTSLRIHDARGQAPVVFVLGWRRIDVPVAGGLFVPQPDILVADQPWTDPLGRLVVSSLWPPLMPSGMEIYFQAWIFDPGALGGLSSSNALRAVCP